MMGMGLGTCLVQLKHLSDVDDIISFTGYIKAAFLHRLLFVSCTGANDPRFSSSAPADIPTANHAAQSGRSRVTPSHRNACVL